MARNRLSFVLLCPDCGSAKEFFVETKEQKKFYVMVNGQKVEVSEEVYRAYVRPVRAQQRTEKRNRRCKVKGARLGLVRCKGNCSECEYAKSGKAFGGVEQSLESLFEAGFEVASELDLEADLLAAEERKEQVKKLHSAIACLTERQQYLIREIYFNGRTQGEIAAAMGATKQAVSNAVRRALASLKKILKEN